MQITFDPIKRSQNLEKHKGYDFADLTEEFFIGSTVLNAKDGRFIAIGAFAGKIVSVIFKPLGTQGIAVISMRRASRKERTIHDQG